MADSVEVKNGVTFNPITCLYQNNLLVNCIMDLIGDCELTLLTDINPPLNRAASSSSFFMMVQLGAMSVDSMENIGFVDIPTTISGGLKYSISPYVGRMLCGEPFDQNRTDAALSESPRQLSLHSRFPLRTGLPLTFPCAVVCSFGLNHHKLWIL